MIDRKKGPPIHTDFDLSLKDVHVVPLDNGMQLVELNTGTQDIIKVELVLRSGRIHESRIGASKAAILLLQEGSEDKDANALAYEYDYYGASVKVRSGMEFSSITLVCLTKFFHKLWPTWLQMVLKPSYKPEEIEKFKSIHSQKLKNQLSKNEVISYRLISEVIFGSKHPYGYNTEPEHITDLKRSDILDYHENELTFDNAVIVISGRYDDAIRNELIGSLSALTKSSNQSTPIFDITEAEGQTIYRKTDNELQASIKMGCRLFPRTHPDYTAFSFVNTILGGYFGSRLMNNIREDKGYTYGIFSMPDCLNHDGFFYISTDVGSTLIQPTIDEVLKEIDILKEKPVDKEELDMVKNYLLGQSLNLIDGPFATGQLIKSLLIKNMTIESFDTHIEKIRNITSDDVQSIAQKYLDINRFTNVIVGGNKV
jgi:predicted Zn-dependent peptidase